jgi:carboxymethylenebutenolidase
MDIQLQVNNQSVNAYLALPASRTGPSVLVLHAWWGLKPFFKQLCDRLAGQGFVVLAPDLRNGEIAKTIDEAKALMEKSDEQFVGDIVMAAKDFLLAHPARTGKKLGALGFSMGANWSLVAATHDPEQFAAVVSFYGAGEADFSKLQAKFMGHFSDADEWEPLKWVNWMVEAMKTTGVDTTIFIYPGLPHWFVEDDRPEYDPAAANLAWERTFAFLKENLDLGVK